MCHPIGQFNCLLVPSQALASPVPPAAVLASRMTGSSCRWRHLNFFQHHCFITAKVPRTDCPEHGVLRINVPWAREGSRFTLLFEQVAMMLVREMPVLAAARIIGITDQRLWRIVEHYVGKAVERLDLTRLKAISLDETAAKRGQTYVTVFIDLDAKDKPVVFVTPGRGKETVAQFEAFLAEHGGVPSRIVEVVCDMSGAFLAAVGADLRAGRRHRRLVPRRADVHQGGRRRPPRRSQTDQAAQGPALGHPQARRRPPHQCPGRGSRRTRNVGPATAIAWRIKEMLRWIRKADGIQAARWRITHFLQPRQPTPRRRSDPRSGSQGAGLPSKTTSSASSSAGLPTTAMRASKASTACSRRPAPEPVATATPQPSRP